MVEFEAVNSFFKYVTQFILGLSIYSVFLVGKAREVKVATHKMKNICVKMQTNSFAHIVDV